MDRINLQTYFTALRRPLALLHERLQLGALHPVLGGVVDLPLLLPRLRADVLVHLQPVAGEPPAAVPALVQVVPGDRGLGALPGGGPRRRGRLRRWRRLRRGHLRWLLGPVVHGLRLSGRRRLREVLGRRGARQGRF